MHTGNNTILVTGASGFVGSYVVRDLVQKGYRVKALRRRPAVPAYINPSVWQQVEWVEGDVMDILLLSDLMQEVSTVIHAAANVSFQEKDQEQMLAVNIEGTANVVNTAIEKNITRFVHVSSVAAFGRNKKIHVNEQQVWEDNKQNTSYAISKYLGEMEVWRGIAEGLNAVIVNPSTILGYGNWNATSNALFKNAFKGFPWYTHGVNGFVDVQDVSRAIVALMESNISGQRFILNSENWSFKQLLDEIAAGFGKKGPHRLATPFLAGLAWRLEKIKTAVTGDRSLISRESAKISRGHTEYDNAKVLEALPGFHFRTLKDTIREACESYLRHIQV